jgi:shikimate kinase
MSDDTSPRVVILLGPKGAGKSSIGHTLEGLGLGTFASIEDCFKNGPFKRIFIEDGDREAAYEWFEAGIRTALATSVETIIFEETAASAPARKMVANLKRDYDAKLVQVTTADVERAVARADARGDTRNFARSQEYIRNSHRVWREETSTLFAFDDSLDNSNLTLEHLEEECRQLASRLTLIRPPEVKDKKMPERNFFRL